MISSVKFYYDYFLDFCCCFFNVERCMWKGGMGELREGTVSGRGWVRRGEGR